MNNTTTQYNAADNDLLQVQDLSKAYANNGTVTQVLNKVNVSVRTGDLLAIIGPSGAGKSTLIRCINRIDQRKRL